MLGLSYPGGPAIQEAAQRGNPLSYRLPRTFLKDEDRLDFSFSGLKTAVRYKIVGPGRPDFTKIALEPQKVADLAASFQEAVVDCLVARRLRPCGKPVWGSSAWARRGGQPPAPSATNGRSPAPRHPVAHRPLALCTDNAVMGRLRSSGSSGPGGRPRPGRLPGR